MANLQEVRKFAEQTLMEQGLSHYWEFEFSHAIYVLGSTTWGWRRKVIKCSRHWAEALSFEEIKNTVLHEIAHVLAARDYNEYHHGPGWRLKCRTLGTPPRRSTKIGKGTVKWRILQELTKKKAKWKAVCTNCEGIHYWVRKLKYQPSLYSCGYCDAPGTLKVSRIA